jgi:hypothetical protein
MLSPSRDDALAVEEDPVQNANHSGEAAVVEIPLLESSQNNEESNNEDEDAQDSELERRNQQMLRMFPVGNSRRVWRLVNS